MIEKLALWLKNYNFQDLWIYLGVKNLIANNLFQIYEETMYERLDVIVQLGFFYPVFVIILFCWLLIIVLTSEVFELPSIEYQT